MLLLEKVTGLLPATEVKLIWRLKSNPKNVLQVPNGNEFLDSIKTYVF